MDEHIDTICAVATPAGRGGVSIVRISGPRCRSLCTALAGREPATRKPQRVFFRDADGQLIDDGLLLYFPAPRSFTGEDVAELHCHGSPVVTQLILNTLVQNGARLAEPGEFSRRAFLNDKIDLAQAEAIADLINSASVTAARYALRSLQGEFSRRVDDLVEALILLRVYVEAALDFPEEEVDFLSDGAVASQLQDIDERLTATLAQARVGNLVREGIQVAIVGEPNAGKSTLLNALSGEDAAIVTDIPGTTRDVLRQHINIDGLPLHILDTAGLRDSTDPVEQEGIRRARQAMEAADLVLLLLDLSKTPDPASHPLWQQLAADERYRDRLLVVLNKCDIATGSAAPAPEAVLSISAKSGQGLAELRELLKQRAGFSSDEEGGFLARQRHVQALELAARHLSAARSCLHEARAGELVAEELRLAQDALGEITGKVSSDALLGRIFSSFCIGK